MEENGTKTENNDIANINKIRRMPDKANYGPAQPPDGGWGWMVVLASSLVLLIVDGIVYSFGIFYYEFLEFYKSGKGETAWVGSLVGGVPLVFGSLAGVLTDKYGCRITTIAGAIIAAAGFVLSTISPNLYFLYFSFGLLSGLGFGLIYLPSITSVGHYFKKKRALAVGLACSGSGIGGFIFNPFTKFLIDKYGWRGAILIQAGIILNCAVCGTIFRPSKLMIATEDDRRTSTTKDKHFDQIRLRKNSTKSVCCSNSLAYLINSIYQLCDFSRLKNGIFILFLVSNVLASLGVNTPLMFLYDFAVDQGIDEDTVKWLGSIVGITNTCGRAICGLFADRVNKLFLYSVALTIVGIASALFPLCSTYVSLVILSCVLGLFQGIYFPLLSVVLVDLLGLEVLHNSFGVLLMFKGIACLIGPPSAGWLFDATGSYTVSYIVSGLTTAVSGIMLIAAPFIRSGHKQKHDEQMPLNNCS